MATLAFKYELALSTQPFDPTPSYTDITAYVLRSPAPEITFGRQDQFSSVEPATLRLALNNRDGRFTQFLATGAYFPNVKIGKRIRVTATYNAVVYRRYDGHVNEWPTAWVTDRVIYATAEITCSDRLKRFGQIGELRSMVEEEVLLDNPAAYYPLSESSDRVLEVGSIAPTIQGGGVVTQFGSGGTLDFGDGTGPGTDGLSAPMFNRASALNGKYIVAELVNPITSATGITVEFWMAITNNADAQYLVELTADKDATFGTEAFNIIHFTIASTGAVAARRYINTVAYTLTPGNILDDGLVHHLALTESLSGSTVTARFYIDGVEAANTTYTRDDLINASRLFMGYRPNNVGAFNLYAGMLAHVAVHPTALSAARLLAHYNSGANGFAGERTDQRIGRLADYIAIPTADRTFDAGDSTVGAQNTSGSQPLEAMRQIEQAEGGVLFLNPADGDLTFHKRTRRYNIAAAFTLDANAKHIQHGLVFPGDDFGMVNDYTVTRVDGSGARAVDQTSIDEYGLYRNTATLPLETDAQAHSAAQWQVGTYGTPHSRLPAVEIALTRLDKISVSLVASIMAATIGTKVRLSNLPTQAPATTIDGFIEGWTEVQDPRDWRIVLNLSPADATVGQVWQLATAGFSELGTTTKLAMG